jgi:gamma-glutamylcyclotransferase (GGCT)/AIG2-like uncharacterized protein YtfP
MRNIFTYGSLMFDPVWSRVVGSRYDRCEAILQGYDRKGVRGEVYPAIIPGGAHSQVPGLVHLDVSTADMEKLDQFEGEYYFRKTVQVITLDMAILPAEIYVLKQEYYAIISNRDWDPVHFATTGIHYFMHNCMDLDEQ